MATGFAVGATYLNLERFRYRDKIRSRATTLHDDLSKKQNYTKYRNFDTVKLIKYLSGLRDHDPMGNDHAKNGDNAAAPPNAGLACWAYNTFYCKHLDRRICVFTCSVSFIGLFLGVTHSAGLLSILDFNLEKAWFSWIVIFSGVLACLLPLAFIKGGNAIVRRLGADAQKAYDQIAGVLQEGISEKASLNAPQPAPAAKAKTRAKK